MSSYSNKYNNNQKLDIKIKETKKHSEKPQFKEKNSYTKPAPLNLPEND